MSRRNSLAAKRQRRWARDYRGKRCIICGRRGWGNLDDESYGSICKPHLAYAVATIFGFAV